MNYEDLKVTRNTIIEDEKVILSYEGKTLLSSSNMSIINGAKGSMKSSCRDYLIENLLSPSGGFESSLDGEILIIDTEMSKRLIQNNLDRFSKDPHIYTLKGKPINEMKKITEYLIEDIRPEVVVIDGSRDFLLNSNDPGESMAVINQLLYWTMNYKVHIINIVHSIQREGGMSKTKGTFGSELENKAETILSMSKFGGEAKVKCAFLRESAPFNDFKLRLDANGRPQRV